MEYGAGDFRYRVVENWGREADGRPFGGVIPSVAVDSQDRVYLARRDPPAILVYAREGRFLTTLGEGTLHSPHSVWIGPRDEMFVADMADHTVRKFSLDGEVLETWGREGTPGPAGMPFNSPTWAVLSPTDELFVSDGYGQHRVHRFGVDGAHQLSWGEEGAGPGQFGLPHGIRVDPRGRVLLADREPNHRIQIFDRNGTFSTEWTDLLSPNDLFIDPDGHVFVAEGGHRISVFDLDGHLLARWGQKGEAPGQFANGPHGVWIDSRGDLYVCEVPHLSDRLQKFARI